jgi:hypothetical protein
MGTVFKYPDTKAGAQPGSRFIISPPINSPLSNRLLGNQTLFRNPPHHLTPKTGILRLTVNPPHIRVMDLPDFSILQWPVNREEVNFRRTSLSLSFFLHTVSPGDPKFQIRKNDLVVADYLMRQLLPETNRLPELVPLNRPDML